MSGSVWAVEVQGTGLWEAGCCDPRCSMEMRCGDGSHTLIDGVNRTTAEAAATTHRKLLATIPDPQAWEPKPSECETCGQSKQAIERLQDLVRSLEEKLAGKPARSVE